MVSWPGHQTNEVIRIGSLEPERAVTDTNPWTAVRLRSLVNQVSRHGSLGRIESNVDLAAIPAPIRILDVEGEAHDSAFLGPRLQLAHQVQSPAEFSRGWLGEENPLVERPNVTDGCPS